MEDRSNASNIGYFLLGLGIGVGAGLLFAPRSGEETRQYLLDKAGEGTDYVKARTDESKDYLRQRTEDVKGAAADLVEKGKGAASDLVEKGKTTVNRQRENLTAAVEAGKQAYRDAVNDVQTAASGDNA
ncbi:MAG TPA: YtxH domain-containing protein [Bryobacteraceae bacterium]|jgi:gas vesicle protein|nr:YtxH domain-containing protein [Bryobacteraceae bacterium]